MSPTSLDAEIRARAAAFTDELVAVIRRSALEAVRAALAGRGAAPAAPRPPTRRLDRAPVVTNGVVRVPARSRSRRGDGVQLASAASSPPAGTFPLSLDHYERMSILRALAEADGDVLAAGRRLGEPRTTIYRRIRELGISKGVPEPGTYLITDEPPSRAAYERLALERALAETGGDVQAAAKLLGVGKSTMYRKVERYGIQAR